LDEAPSFKVKRIEVLPGKRLSYQKHAQRAEHWYVVAGTAKVTLDGREITVGTGESIDIPIGGAHRVENPGTDGLIFIEVQRGNYLGRSPRPQTTNKASGPPSKNLFADLTGVTPLVQ
jgi:mannose-6-phosphate isomerase